MEPASSSSAAGGVTTLKAVLLGNGSAGKSSIAARFRDDGFRRVYKQTIGVDWVEKRLVLRGKEVVLQVWDIGGQSLSSPMMSRYTAAADALFLVYDVTDAQSFADLEDWLAAAVKARSSSSGTEAGATPPPAVYVVGNKVDLSHLRRVSEEAHEGFVTKHALAGGFFMSARSGENVLTGFYKAAAARVGIELTPAELELTAKVLAVTVDDASAAAADAARTAEAEAIEAEDAAAEAARARGGVLAKCGCVLQ